MLRKIHIILSMCMFCGYVYGVNLIPDNTEETDRIAVEISKTYDMAFADIGGKGDFTPLENYVKENNPDLYNLAQSDTHVHQRWLYRSYVMKDIFDKYKTHYIQDITNMSNLTGRKLITKSEESVGRVIKIVDGIEQSWKLDDTDFKFDCGYPPQFKHTEATKWCHIKDDLEEYEVEYKADGYGYNKMVGDNIINNNYRIASGEYLRVMKSILAENRYSTYNFSLGIITDSDEAKICQKYGLVGQYRLSFYYDDVNREEQYKYWNQEVDDALAGKAVLKGKFCNSSGECLTVWSDVDPKKWKSNFMIPVGRIGNAFSL